MDDIFSLSRKFENFEELKKYSDKQYSALVKAHDTITRLQEEIKHLQGLIAATQPLIGENETTVVVKSSEQTICEMEIEKLKATSMNRSLTLEETKRLDLLVKNLLLCKGQYKDIEPPYKKQQPLSAEKLLEIASAPEPSAEGV